LPSTIVGAVHGVALADLLDMLLLLLLSDV